MRKWTEKAKELIGTKFGGTWTVQSMFGECKEDYIKAVQDLYDVVIDCHNAQYWCHNSLCGINTVMEKTTISRGIDKPAMKFCNNCDGSYKDICHYAIPIRYKPLNKIPDRQQKVFVGNTYNDFTVLAIRPANTDLDHQCKATIKCNKCGKIQESRFDTLLNGTHKCNHIV